MCAISRAVYVVSCAAIALLLLAHDALALNNTDYEKYKSSSQRFAKADEKLNTLWTTIKKNIPPEQYKALLDEQRNWLRNGYDNEASLHMSSMQPADAYALALDNRIGALEKRFGSVLQSSGEMNASESDFDVIAEQQHQDLKARNATQAPAGSLAAQQVSMPAAGTGTTLVAAAPPAPSPAQQNPSRVQVEAEGVGATKMEALQAAWMDAVRNAVGMFMTANTRLEDDKLTEQVVTHSRGQVNSYEVLSETQQNNLWSIKIRANIDKDILQETAKAAQSKTVAFDGTAAVAQQSTQKTKAETQIEALKASRDLFKFDDCLVYDFEVIREDGDKSKKPVFYGIHSISIDMKKYLQRVKAITAFLEKICTKSNRINFNDQYITASRAVINAKLDDLQAKDIGVNHRYDRFGFSFRPPNTNTILIADNTSSVMAYYFENDVNCDHIFWNLKNVKFTFTVEHADSFDGVASSREYFFRYIYNWYCGFAPVFYHEFDSVTYTHFKCKVKLNLTDDQLINVKGLSGKYTLHYKQ